VALTLGLGLATFATESGFREVVHLEGLFREEEAFLLRIPGLRAAVLTSVP
tara:strand:+ start:1770 stop:1922 length:153 start_codon:yes stop_codon:yes gene_type:complete